MQSDPDSMKRLSRTSVMAAASPDPVMRRTGRGSAGMEPPGGDMAAVAAAAQVFETGLVALWVSRFDAVPAGAGAGAPDRSTAIASITYRANGLAMRATIAAGRACAPRRRFPDASASA